MAVGHAIVSSDLEQNLNGKSTSNRSNILDIAAKHLRVSEKGKINYCEAVTTFITTFVTHS
jgi:hypothetical protein